MMKFYLFSNLFPGKQVFFYCLNCEIYVANITKK